MQLGSLKQYEMFIYGGKMYQRLSDPGKPDSRGVVRVLLSAEYSNKMWKFLPPGGTTTMHESYEVEGDITFTLLSYLRDE